MFIEVVLVVLYACCLIYLLLFCIAELHLLIRYQIYKSRGEQTIKFLSQDIAINEHPLVTIQLPVFNEMYVVERIIDAVCLFNYPKERMQIQILDDSTDNTIEISQAKANFYKNKGFDIEVIHREGKSRKGYKAGALKDAMPLVKADFIVLFDADFIPAPNFLRQVLPYFENPEIGFIQTGWAHINRNYSMLTRIQAFFIDVHFSVEQAGRNSSGVFMSFNGTSGVWKKQAILDAGNWESDTLTEDVDLSYRAQLAGYKGLFLERIKSPAELPADMPAFKSQQFRWVKGGVETAIKILPRVVKSKFSFYIKINAFAHLLNCFAYLAVFTMAVISVPLMLLKNTYIHYKYMWLFNTFFVNNIVFVIVYVVGLRNNQFSWAKVVKEVLTLFPIFSVLTIGLSFHNSIAAVKGILGQKTPFERTPKYDITEKKDTWNNKQYATKRLDNISIMEGLLAVYFFIGVLLGIYKNIPDFRAFHIVACIGFSMIFAYSFVHTKSNK